MDFGPRKYFSTAEKFEDFLNHLPVTASDIALMALKGHLLVEQALREFIEKRVAKPELLQEKQIAFPTLLIFASSLDDGDSMNWVWVAAGKLNTLRNQLAHNLNPKKIESLERDFVKYVKDNDGEMLVPLEDPHLKYSDFPRSIFQIYDRILSYPYMSPIDMAWRNYAISSAMSALSSIDQAKPKHHGPTPRKKWPNPR